MKKFLGELRGRRRLRESLRVMKGAALQAVAVMQQGTEIDLDGPSALTAARLSTEHHLPMADSTILATVRCLDASVDTGRRFQGHAGG